MIVNEKSGTLSREQVWLTAWIQVAASSNCTDKKVPDAWADHCLESFDKRFPPTVAAE